MMCRIKNHLCPPLFNGTISALYLSGRLVVGGLKGVWQFSDGHW